MYVCMYVFMYICVTSQKRTSSSETSDFWNAIFHCGPLPYSEGHLHSEGPANHASLDLSVKFGPKL